MKRTLLIILILGAIGSFSYWKREGLINRLSQLKQQAPKVSSYVETSAYVANVDINEISERGALFRDYNRDEWEEKAKNLTTEAITYDYDFKSIEELAESLKNVDRLSVMKTVFSQITENKKKCSRKI